WSGTRIRIRFHLFQDSADVLNLVGLGWYIDDVQVVAAAGCHAGHVRLDGPARDCGGAPIEGRLWDSDLNADPLAAESATVRLTSPSDPSPLDVELTETGPDTGVFFTTAPFGRTGSPGVLGVSEGDVVTATYLDADDGTGAPAVATDVTSIVDCTPPV